MKHQRSIFLVLALASALLLIITGLSWAKGSRAETSLASTTSLDTGFTYQGYLTDGGSPANGSYDFQFELFDAEVDGTSIMVTTAGDVQVADGLFTVLLDFSAGAFNGDDRWLEISVRPGAETGPYTLLGGRQRISPAPYAFYAIEAGSVPWNDIQNRPSGLDDGDDDTTYTAGNGLLLDGSQFLAQGSPFAHWIVVAKSGGDYPSIQSAIDSIGDAAAENPYLVWVAPGIYSETVKLKPYVHLQGAGQGASIITSMATNTSPPTVQATLVVTYSTSVRDITLENTGVEGYCAALYAPPGTSQTQLSDATLHTHGFGVVNYALYISGSGTEVSLLDLTATGEGASVLNIGLWLDNGADVIVTGGSYTGSGGNSAAGIRNNTGNAILKTTNTIALGEYGSQQNYGLFNGTDVSSTLQGGTFVARGGTYAQGIYNMGTLETSNTVALGEDGTSNNYGLDNYGGKAILHGGSLSAHGGLTAFGIQANGTSDVEVTNAKLLGESGASYNNGLRALDGLVKLGLTMVVGGVYQESATITCFQVYDGNFAAVSCP
jgi:hypothetical protein